MLTTIKGYYDHGQIVLDEMPPIQTRTEVMVTFLRDDVAQDKMPKRTLGGFEGKVNIPADFNEPSGL